MSIHIYTQSFRSSDPWDDAEERAISAGYSVNHIAGEMLQIYGCKGGPFGVFKEGKLLARFDNWIDRRKWLHKQLAVKYATEAHL